LKTYVERANYAPVKTDPEWPNTKTYFRKLMIFEEGGVRGESLA
jgi:hypothetical protein